MIDFMVFVWMGLGRLVLFVVAIGIPIWLVTKFLKLRQRHRASLEDTSSETARGFFPYSWNIIRSETERFWSNYAIHLFGAGFILLVLFGTYSGMKKRERFEARLKEAVELGEMTHEEAKEWYESAMKDAHDEYMADRME